MIHLTIINLKEKIFEGNVEAITIPGEAGELTVLPNHVPIVTAIKKGSISALIAQDPSASSGQGKRYEREERKHFESKGGIFEFTNNEATILL